jgi:hypothetical protein
MCHRVNYMLRGRKIHIICKYCVHSLTMVLCCKWQIFQKYEPNQTALSDQKV